MKITGIIAEYDPLHRGHAYHLRRAREITGADCIVVALGGFFTQRGAPALFDKFARAAMALRCGADAVVELPQVYASRPAEQFALGGVDTLDALGCDCLCFGCEIDEMDRLFALQAEKKRLDGELRPLLLANLKQGKSYPRAAGEALESAGAQARLLKEPNLILALEYLGAIQQLSSRMVPFAVKRSAPYHAQAGETESASAIRALIASGRWEEALSALPPDCAKICAGEGQGGLCAPGRLDAYILTRLRETPPGQAASCEEDSLVNRLLRLSRQSAGVEELTELVKCKRYTRARISRLITELCLALPKAPARVPYLHLLGARKDADFLLKELSRRARLPLHSGASGLMDSELFQAECRAADLWGLSTAKAEYRRAGRELTHKFLRV